MLRDIKLEMKNLRSMIYYLMYKCVIMLLQALSRLIIVSIV